MPIHKYWDIVRAIEDSQISLEGKDYKYLYTFTLTDREKMSSKVIRASFNQLSSHAGIILPARVGELPRILHMTSKGCCVDFLIDVLKECDVFCVQKYIVPKESVDLVAKRINFILDSKAAITYDFVGDLTTTFDWKVIDKLLLENKYPVLRKETNIYCSELVRAILLGVKYLPVRKEYNREVFTPDDVANYCDGTIFNYTPELKKQSIIKTILLLTISPIIILMSLL
jgi:hypothetical protein